jgi:cytochrome c553
MSGERLVHWRNRWFALSVAAMLGIGLAAALIGFVWLPSKQRDFSAAGLWDSICRAAGVPASWSEPAASRLAARSSQVVMLPALSNPGSAIAIGRGASLALQCSICHSPGGAIASSAPLLAGQRREVIYKQLHDYRGGSRQNPVMQALAAPLGDRDIDDLADYYASLPRHAVALQADARPVAGSAAGSALVRVGDPLRNIAPCASCHGAVGQKAGSPLLEGMPQLYLAAQLRNFASSARGNDAHGVMRNMARQLTAAEINDVALFYSRQN